MKLSRSAFSLGFIALFISTLAFGAPGGPTHETGTNFSPEPLAYGGGDTNHIGVMSGVPNVYIVFWGGGWGAESVNSDGDYVFSNDRMGAAPKLQRFFHDMGTGNDQWSGILTQYCDGLLLANHALSCPSNAPHVRYPAGGAFMGAWYDNTSPASKTPSLTDLANEASRAANHFGNISASSNRYAVYVIVSPTGYAPSSFGSDPEMCADHDSTQDLSVSSPANNDIAFLDIPYVTDKAICATKGSSDDFTIIASHEYAEAVTDITPDQGWSVPRTYLDAAGDEIADDCDTPESVTMGNNSYWVVQLWSIDPTAPGCASTHTTVTGTGANGIPEAKNSSYEVDSNMQLSGGLSASDDNGNTLTYSVIVMPSHGSLTYNSQSGAFTYTPNTNYVGTDSFSFDASDGGTFPNGGPSNSAFVSIKIIALSPPTLSDEYTQCVNGSDKYLIEWGPGANGTPSQYHVDYSVAGGSWTSFYTGSMILKNFAIRAGTAVAFRAKASDGVIWTDYSTLNFTAAPCTPAP